jgi:hypothetical protein
LLSEPTGYQILAVEHMTFSAAGRAAFNDLANAVVDVDQPI